ncbi:hypothetical protein pdul_cds_908 [Pandoravirus dulcis]|uniref:Uncharacterized protein n=1 Tax=Pandoravirus dulcis TaxID=1349409 RepID=S4VRY0_9VIRU|nr:hypothetical protein pdul_cds_908 [Pandoravirus dulcis]AGO83143.2 hypothetical protein pdul_cds_908 [Pandoravirus dulcis]
MKERKKERVSDRQKECISRDGGPRHAIERKRKMAEPTAAGGNRKAREKSARTGRGPLKYIRAAPMMSAPPLRSADGRSTVRGAIAITAATPDSRRLLRERLDERTAARRTAHADRETALQREHDHTVVEKRVAAAWAVDGPRWVNVNETRPVRMESRAVLVDILVALAWHAPTHLTAVIDDVDLVAIAGGDLYFAHRLARVLPAARKIIAAQDLARLDSLCAFVAHLIDRPSGAARHRILLADGTTEVECRARPILLPFILAVLEAVRAYLASAPSLAVPATASTRASTTTTNARAVQCAPCPAPAGTLWPHAFAMRVLGDARTVTTPDVVYRRETCNVWLRCTMTRTITLQSDAAAEWLVRDYCMWGGPLCDEASRPVHDPVIGWAASLRLSVAMDGACLAAIERALAQAIARCAPDYVMHGVFRAMLDCVGVVEASPRIRHCVIAPAVLAGMGA